MTDMSLFAKLPGTELRVNLFEIQAYKPGPTTGIGGARTTQMWLKDRPDPVTCDAPVEELDKLFAITPV